MDISEAVEQGVDTEANPRSSTKASALPRRDAEGVLGGLDTGTYHDNLIKFARLFRSPKNAEIAALVTEQDTWINRVHVACHLWNRADDNDTYNATFVRGQLGVEEAGDSNEIWHGDSVITPIIEEFD
ncbi:hypothetical protein PG991_013117 [Apiospora marii]|uniref:Uncharacterized protein n=1 Tax=Apiospora marii TaxID=335849 RepID=A0ABR1R511_9PEZI